MWREDRPAAQAHSGSHAQIKLHSSNRLVPAQGTQLITQGEQMITEQMKQEQVRVLKKLVAQHPDRDVSVCWDWESVIRGRPRMIIKKGKS